MMSVGLLEGGVKGDLNQDLLETWELKCDGGISDLSVI